MLIFLDVETTGLNPSLGDSICEIAMAEFSLDGKILSRYVRLVKPSASIPKKVSAIHGITAEMVETAVSFLDIGSEVVRYLTKSELVLGYNVKFDLDFLKAEFTRIGMSMPKIHYVDVLELARRYLPGRSSYKLSRVARDLGFESKGYHWAEDDVMATAYIFFRMAKDIPLFKENLFSKWIRRYGGWEEVGKKEER